MKTEKEGFKKFFKNFCSNVGSNLVKKLPAAVSKFGFHSAEVYYKNLLHIKDSNLQPFEFYEVLVQV